MQHGPVIKLSSLRCSRLFLCVSIVLLALFGIAQVHEAFPFLHHEEEFPGDFCPFCIIKYALAFALILYTLLCAYPQLRQRALQPSYPFSPLHITLRFSTRAPPVFTVVWDNQHPFSPCIHLPRRNPFFARLQKTMDLSGSFPTCNWKSLGLKTPFIWIAVFLSFILVLCT